jgi:hypothetical protein
VVFPHDPLGGDGTIGLHDQPTDVDGPGMFSSEPASATPAWLILIRMVELYRVNRIERCAKRGTTRLANAKASLSIVYMENPHIGGGDIVGLHLAIH